VTDIKILVTGGAGFLGSHFVKRTLDLNSRYNITVLDALTYAGNLENLPNQSESFRFIRGNILDEQIVFEETSKADLVVHFAAETHNDNSLTLPTKFFETNVLGTEIVARAASTLGKRFHHVSTDEVFGDLPIGSSEKFNEDSRYRPSSPYSASKAASDHLVRSYVRSFGLRGTITNCSNNFGSHQNWEKLIPQSIRTALMNKPIQIYGTGRNVRDWIHVDDHTDGIWAVLNRGEIGETYLLGGDNELDNLAIASKILSILGLPEDHIEFVDDRPGHDLRYAIDFSKAGHNLKWEPVKTRNFEEEFESVVLHYKERISNGEKIA
jgi:dTDP-glucose 4,6-dehydratase